jgi:hypothetical protein
VKEVVKRCRLDCLEEVQMATTESLKEAEEAFPKKVPSLPEVCENRRKLL